MKIGICHLCRYVNHVVYFSCYIVKVILHILGYILKFSLNLLSRDVGFAKDALYLYSYKWTNFEISFPLFIIYFQIRIERYNIPIDIDDISCNLVWWIMFILRITCSYNSVDTVKMLSLAVCFSLKFFKLATSLLVGMTLSAKCSALK